MNYYRLLNGFAVIEGFSLPADNTSPSMYPVATFSRQRLTMTRPEPSSSNSIQSIRKTYDNLIKPMQPEPRGERIGFFDQVGYVVKGVAGTVAVLGIVGVWYGGRAVRRWL
jgi:hypothetical protein